MNECSTSDYWTIAVSTAGDNNGAQYDVKVSSDNCDILAPSMGKLDHDGVATVGGSAG